MPDKKINVATAKNEAWLRECRVNGFTKDVPVLHQSFFDAGYAAGLAARDGWVEIVSTDELPKEDGRYQMQERHGDGAILTVDFRTDGDCDWFAKHFIAWMRLPERFTPANGATEENL